MSVTAIEPTVRVTIECLRAYGIEAFVQAGLPEEGAATITDVQLEAALRGQPTHDMGDVPGYCRRIKSGQMNPRPEIRTIKETPFSVRLDGDNGPGQWVSVVAQGKIGLAIAEGKPIPPGWMMDKRGRVTTDPADAADRMGVPIAEHKGYGLALVMETLAGVMTGAKFSLDHDRETFRGGAEEHDLGHFFLALNPEMFMPIDEFKARVDRMIDDVKKGDVAEGVKEVLLPGEIELRNRQNNLRDGVPLRPSTLRRLQEYKKTADLRAELVEIPRS